MPAPNPFGARHRSGVIPERSRTGAFLRRVVVSRSGQNLGEKRFRWLDAEALAQ
jgi:hypothetical protein